MFFVLSKVLWFLIKPLTLLLILLVVGLVARRFGWKRSGTVLIGVFFVAIALFEYTSLGALALAPLEARFPAKNDLPADVTGFIVLGGALEAGDRAIGRHQVGLNGAAERMTEAVVLARRYPEARLAFTGFSGALNPKGPSEADLARRFFDSMGVDAARVVYEDRSRNTAENARFLKDMIAPKDSEIWVLITSAAHMPRSVGCFRQAGWDVLPYPVDYVLGKTVSFQLKPSGGGLGSVNHALHEWLGLLAYRFTDRIPTLFPAPAPADAE